MVDPRKPKVSARTGNISNVKIGGRTARRTSSGSYTTDRSKWVAPTQPKPTPTPSKVAPIIKLQPTPAPTPTPTPTPKGFSKGEIAPTIKLEKREFGTGDPSQFTALEKTIATLTYGKGMGAGLTSEEKERISQQRGIAAGTFAATGILGGAVLGGLGKLIPAGAKYLRVGKVAAFGKTPGGAIGKLPTGVLGKVASNTKTISLTKRLLAKVGLSPAGAIFISTAIGTYPFARFEIAESVDKLGIAMFSAQQAGDTEAVIELANLIEEVGNPTILDRILHLIPFVNIYAAASRNVRNAIKSANVFKYLAEQERIKIETGETEADKWERIEEERELKNTQRKADDEMYWEQVAENQKRARDQQRQEDEEYWRNIASKKEEKQRADRLAEEKYWEDIRKKNQEIKEQQRADNEEYWANIYLNKKTGVDMTPSQLDFGLL